MRFIAKMVRYSAKVTGFFFAKYRESLALNGFILEKLKYFTCENDPNLAFVKARLHVFIWLNQYKKIRHST